MILFDLVTEIIFLMENFRLYVEDGHESNLLFSVLCQNFVLIFPNFSHVVIIIMMKYPYFYGSFPSFFMET